MISNENEQLIAIIAKSINTVKGNTFKFRKVEGAGH